MASVTFALSDDLSVGLLDRVGEATNTLVSDTLTISASHGAGRGFFVSDSLVLLDFVDYSLYKTIIEVIDTVNLGDSVAALGTYGWATSDVLSFSDSIIFPLWFISADTLSLLDSSATTTATVFSAILILATDSNNLNDSVQQGFNEQLAIGDGLNLSDDCQSLPLSLIDPYLRRWLNDVI